MEHVDTRVQTLAQDNDIGLLALQGNALDTSARFASGSASKGLPSIPSPNDGAGLAR